MARVLTIDLADEAGISYRMADHWCRKGYIKPRPRHDGTEEYGSGVAREFDAAELAVAVEMAALVRCGFTPKAAAPLARRLLAAPSVVTGTEAVLHQPVHLGGELWVWRCAPVASSDDARAGHVLDEQRREAADA